jgi:hypothetical protein
MLDNFSVISVLEEENTPFPQKARLSGLLSLQGGLSTLRQIKLNQTDHQIFTT